MDVKIDLTEKIRNLHKRDGFVTINAPDRLWKLATVGAMVLRGEVDNEEKWDGPRTEEAIIDTLLQAGKASFELTVGDVLLESLAHIEVDDNDKPKSIPREQRRTRAGLTRRIESDEDILKVDDARALELLGFCEKRYETNAVVLLRMTAVIDDAIQVAKDEERGKSEAKTAAPEAEAAEEPTGGAEAEAAAGTAAE